jgi:hypothetical protein
MIARGALEQWLGERLAKLDDQGQISVRTYKGDRGLTLRRTQAGFELTEDGYVDQTQTFPDRRSLMKAVKTAARREFPRSNQLRTKG